jgi:hypothetical protein
VGSIPTPGSSVYKGFGDIEVAKIPTFIPTKKSRNMTDFAVIIPGRSDYLFITLFTQRIKFCVALDR